MEEEKESKEEEKIRKQMYCFYVVFLTCIVQNSITPQKITYSS
jgi:hypothetical protein